MNFQLPVLVFLSVISSLFICSFSSVLSAILLVFSTLLLISMMYWNLFDIIPLYLFSLFIMGGLYVLIGFVMMADMSDLDMVVSGKLKEYIWSFSGILFGMSLNSFSVDVDFVDYESFSPVKSNDWSTWGLIPSVYIFLIFILFIFLFVLHTMMKSSTSGGGFVK